MYAIKDIRRTSPEHARVTFRRAYRLWKRATERRDTRTAQRHAETLKLLKWRYRSLLSA